MRESLHYPPSLNKKTTFTKQFYFSLLFLVLSTFITKSLFAQSPVIDSLGDAYFFHSNDHPDDATPSWGNADWATGGLAHDNNNWYIASNNRGKPFGRTLKTDWAIWRWPVSEDLNQGLDNGDHGVTTFQLSKSNPDAIFKQYGHIGDIDYCTDDNGIGYIVAPLTGGGGLQPIIAFIRASDLHFINYSYLSNQSGAGWCAVNPKNGDLYTSENQAAEMLQYQIDWSLVAISHNALKPRPNHGIPLLYNMQGGEFTPNGDLLYVSCGIVENDKYRIHTHAYSEDGIHVFDTLNWQDIQRSTNHDREPTYCFDFAFDNYDFYLNESNWDLLNDDIYGQEPEGLTIWDLNDGRAPNVTGQLHVLVDDHNSYIPWTSSSDLTIKHYKSFKNFPKHDITVYGTSAANGVSATNIEIAAFLNIGKIYNNCADIYNNAPGIFLPGKTPVVFTVTDHKTVKVVDTAYVTVANRHEECSTALTIQSCDKIIVDNYCAALSNSVPDITGYSRPIKDVWFKIYPTNSSFSIETFQVAGGLTNTVMQVLSGTCGNLHEIATDDNSGDGEHAKVVIRGLSNLDPLYVRVTDYGASHYGQFGIYFNKNLDTGMKLFSEKEFVAGDGSGVHQYPTLIGDVNGDGKSDLIFIGQDWGADINLCVRVKLGNTDGTFTALPQQNFGDGSMVHAYPTLIGDVNGDGRSDLIFKGQDWGGDVNLCVRVKLGNADGTFTALPQQDFGDGSMVHAYPTLIGDVNGDGRSDLIFKGQDWGGDVNLCVRVKLGNADGTFTALPQQNFGDGSMVHAYPTLIGDVNGDGRSDLIFKGQDWGGDVNLCVRVKLGNADGTFTALPQQDFGDGSMVHAYPTLIGDVNGDGRSDLIFKGQDWGGDVNLCVRVKLGNADGTFTALPQQNFGDGSMVQAYPTLIGDVNGDGNADLIFVGQNWNGCGLNIRIRFSKGDGTWCYGWQVFGDGSGVHQYPTLTGDANGDGKTDVIFNFNDNTQGLIIRSKISYGFNCAQEDSTSSPLPISSVLIFPNPTSNYIQFKSDTIKTWNIIITNSTGVVVQSYNKVTSSTRLNLSSLFSGLYFVDILDINSGKRIRGKVIKISH